MADRLPRNVKYDETLQVGQWDPDAVTLQLHTLIQIAECLVNNLLAPDHTVPARFENVTFTTQARDLHDTRHDLHDTKT